MKDQRRLRLQRGKIFLLVDQRTIEKINVDLGWIVCHLDKKRKEGLLWFLNKFNPLSPFHFTIQKWKKKISLDPINQRHHSIHYFYAHFSLIRNLSSKIQSVKKIQRHTPSYRNKIISTSWIIISSRDLVIVSFMQRRIVQNLISWRAEKKKERVEGEWTKRGFHPVKELGRVSRLPIEQRPWHWGCSLPVARMVRYSYTLQANAIRSYQGRAD